MTVEEHVSLVEAFKPDTFEALCDSASSFTNKPKRIRKSVDRTLSFLDQTLALRVENQVNRGSADGVSPTCLLLMRWWCLGPSAVHAAGSHSGGRPD